MSEEIGSEQPRNACVGAPATTLEWGMLSYTDHTGTEASDGKGYLSVKTVPGKVDLRELQLPEAGNGVLTFVPGWLFVEVAAVCKP